MAPALFAWITQLVPAGAQVATQTAYHEAVSNIVLGGGIARPLGALVPFVSIAATVLSLPYG